ncbi:MAG: hypothetical protein AB7N65_05285 [Vicinamibacterales bacterium]
MLRLILLLILIAFLARAFWRLMDGVIEGVRGSGSFGPNAAGRRAAGGRASQVQSVHMARDPVCGTFVVPERAVTLAQPDGVVYFCSTRCRDAYQPAERSPRPEPMRGRSA